MQLFNQFASSAEAKKRCEDWGNEDGVKLNEDALDELIALLPHGSGIDGDWHHEYLDGRIHLYNSFHMMDENGFYDRWIDFEEIVRPNLEFNFEVIVKGRFAEHPMVKEYLEEIVSGTIGCEVKLGSDGHVYEVEA